MHTLKTIIIILVLIGHMNMANATSQPEEISDSLPHANLKLKSQSNLPAKNESSQDVNIEDGLDKRLAKDLGTDLEEDPENTTLDKSTLPSFLQHESPKVENKAESAATSRMAILKTLAGLGVTVLVILVFSYLAKKFGLQNINNNKHMHVVSSLSLGQKERAVLIQVNHQTLLIGVSQGSVNLLKTIEAPDMHIQDDRNTLYKPHIQGKPPNSSYNSARNKSSHKFSSGNKQRLSESDKKNTENFKKIFIQQEQKSNINKSQLSTFGTLSVMAVYKNIKRFIDRK